MIDEVPLDLPEQTLTTQAVWWTLPDDLLAEQRAASPPTCPGAAHAAEHCSIGLLPLFATCDRWDIGGVSTAHHADTGRLTVFVYDGHPGGAGISARGFAAARAWLRRHPGDHPVVRLPRRLPVVRAVAQVRQPEPPTRQGRSRTAPRRPSRRRTARVACSA